MTGPAEHDWARRTLTLSLWQSSALGLSLWQLGLGLLVAASTPSYAGGLLAAHLLLGAAGALLCRVPVGEPTRAAWFALLVALLGSDVLLAGSQLALQAVCMSFLVCATPFLALPRRYAVLTLPVGLAMAGLVWVQVGQEVGVALLAPLLCFAAPAALLRSTLLRTADHVDATAATARTEHEALVAGQARARVAAEQARTLHDTAINTLAAIAQGGAAVRDLGQVRRRCAADVAAVRAAEHGGPPPAGLDDLPGALGIPVRWTGLDEAARRQAWQALGPERGALLTGLVRELLVNAHKHATGSPVRIRVGREAETLVVVVEDHGPGFDPATTTLRGLRSSVLDRASQAGFGVVVDSRPGGGTRVTVRCPIPTTLEAALVPVVATARDQVRRAGTWGWCLGVGTALLALSLLAGAALASTTAALLVLTACLVARQVSRPARPLALSMSWLLVALVPVGFVLAFAGSHAEDSQVLLWQGVAVAPLLVVLLNTSRPTHLVLAVIGLLGAAAGCAWWERAQPDVATAALLNGGIHLSQLVVWLLFQRVLVQLARVEEAALEESVADQVHRASIEEATRTRERWQSAQVDRALALLSDVADGRAAPTDATVVRAAGLEERAMRQLLLLPPDLVHLGPWLARAISTARDRGIDLDLRIGDTDVSEREVADRLGARLLAALEHLPGGRSVVVSCFRASEEPLLTLVCNTDTWVVPPALGPGSTAVQTYGAQRLVVLAPG